MELSVNDLQPGMTFSKPLLDEKGARIAPPNSPITDEEISLLRKWNIKKITTEGVITSGHSTEQQKNIEIEEKKPEQKLLLGITKAEKIKLLTLYDGWISRTSEILGNLSKGLKVERTDIIEIIDKIVLAAPKNKNAFLSIIQSRQTSEYVYGHSLNLSILSVIIGAGLKYTNVELRLLGISALLCDTGMLKIPKHIREKEHALTEADIKHIRTAPMQTYKLLSNYGQFDPVVAEIGLQHHERYDGTGYPKGLKGDEIHEYARIIAVADSFDAMTKSRSFRKEKIPHTIMKELLKDVEKRFDPKIMKVFLTYTAIYPVGSVVQLNTKEIGIVIAANEKSPLKPVLKIIYNSDLQRMSEPKILNLLENEGVKVTGVVNPKELGISVVNEL